MPKHTKKDQDFLDTLDRFEKSRRVSRNAFAERGALLLSCRHYYISLNEMPYKGSKMHLCLRSEMKDWRNNSELLQFMSTLRGFQIIKNSDTESSVSSIPHFHLVRW